MTRIRTRSPGGVEYLFSREELAGAIRRGGVTQEWHVYHTVSGQWLPVTAHPAYAEAQTREGSPRDRSRRSSELVLIYPEMDPTGAARPPEAPGIEAEAPTRPVGRRWSSPKTEREWSTAVRRPSAPTPAPPTGVPLFEWLLIIALVVLVIAAAISAIRPQPHRTETPPHSVQTDRPAPTP